MYKDGMPGARQSVLQKAWRGANNRPMVTNAQTEDNHSSQKHAIKSDKALNYRYPTEKLPTRSDVRSEKSSRQNGALLHFTRNEGDAYTLTCSTAKGANFAMVMIVNHTLPKAGASTMFKIWEQGVWRLTHGKRGCPI